MRERYVLLLSKVANTGYLIKRHKIVSRKGTDKRTRAMREKEERRLQSMKDFVATFKSRKHLYRNRMIWKFDHSSFNHDISSDRTLSWQGERDTAVEVDQANKASHSYTVLPLISRDGKTIGILFLCFQETNNAFGRDKSRRFGTKLSKCCCTGNNTR